MKIDIITSSCLTSPCTVTNIAVTLAPQEAEHLIEGLQSVCCGGNGANISQRLGNELSATLIKIA